MADKKISDLNSLAIAAAQDLFVIVDIDQDETKHIRKDSLMASPGPIGSINPDTGEFTTIQVTAGATIDEFSTDGTLVGNSDTALPTEQAVKTYVDTVAAGKYHNDLLGLQGGDSTSEFYHLTQAIHDSLFSESPTIGLGSPTGTYLKVDYGNHIVYIAPNNNETLRVEESSVTVTGDVHVTGDVLIDGTTFTVNTIVIEAQDPIITVNKGETGPGVTGGLAGIRVDRGTLTDYRIIFDESDDYFKVGLVGSEQRVALYGDHTSYEHNSLAGLQGGDSTSEFYHITAQTHSFLGSDSTGIVITGDLNVTGDGHFDDIYVSSSTIYLGNSQITEHASGGANIIGNLDVSERGAIGSNATVNYGLPTASYSIPLVIAEEPTIPDTFVGQYILAQNKKSGSGVNSTGQYIYLVHDTTTDIDEITGANVFASISNDAGATVDLLRGVSAVVGHTSYNSTVAEAVAGEFIVSSGFSMTNAELTTAVAGRFQIFNYGSGDIDVTNAYAIQIKAPGFNSTGLTANLYGLYIEDQLSGGFTNTYNLYSAGSTAENYIEGNLQVDGNFNLASGVSANEISNDSSLASASATALVTESAIKTYVDDPLISMSEPTGFENRTDTTISFGADGTTTFSIEPTGASFDVWMQGLKYTYTSKQSVSITPAEGTHFFYFDYTDQQLKSSTSFPTDLLTKHGYCGVIYWDADAGEHIYFGDERHGITMDGATHSHFHNDRGTLWRSGVALGDITADGSGDSDLSCIFSITSGLITDEDIDHSIPADTTAYVPIFYKSGASGVWRRLTATMFPATTTGSGRLAYNQFTGGSWQISEVSNNQFALAHIAVTNDPDQPTIAVMGQATYGNVTAAREGASTEINNLVLTGLAFEEFVFVGTLIYQTSDTYTNTLKSRIRSTDEGGDYVDFRQFTRASTGATNDHGNLSGLNDDDHLQYALLTGARAFTGDVTINASLTLNAGDPADEISNDTTLADDSTSALVTEHAVKGYIDNIVETDVIAGAENIPNGVNTISVSFDTPQPDGEYSVVGNLLNNADANPSLYVHIIRNQSVNGFDVLFSGVMDSANYEFAWILARYNPIPVTGDARLTDDDEIRLTDDSEVRLTD